MVRQGRPATFFTWEVDLPLKTVLNTEGRDITADLCTAAEEAGIDPVGLLALAKAEAGLNPKAERWGMRTGDAKRAIAAHDLLWLQRIVDDAWADVSFGYSQRIVLYHDFGDRTATAANCLAVREHVFANELEDLQAAARRLAVNIPHSLDGTILGGLIVYNAGSDRRNDPAWMAQWSANVVNYQSALNWAETFRRS